MKIITLWQPWATMIAIGWKKVETRHWYTSYRGQLAIHAAKRKMDADGLHSWKLACKEAYRIDLDIPDFKDFHFGKIVAYSELSDCLRMTTQNILEQPQLEILSGNWELGRFAWQLSSIRSLTNPIEYKGSQGLKDLDEQIAADVCIDVGVNSNRLLT